MSKNYVIHFCRNKECNNGWIDIDKTKVKTIPPSWKYCKECAKKLGIDFDKQSPSDTKSEKQVKREEKLQKAHAEFLSTKKNQE